MNDASTAVAPWIAGQTRQLLAQRGHAWLLQGPSGLGQYDLALALVRAWLCDQPSGQGACGACGSCHAIDVHAHADLTVLMPETVMIELGWPLGEKAQKEIDDQRKPSKEIRVEAMRDTVEFAQRTSARGRGKAVLVYPAERMNPVTANALLKTLEEPPGEVRFVLASEAAHLLPPTIRSRCQTHTMHWPDAAQALVWLAGQGVPPEDAQVLLRASGGRPEDALRFARSGRNAVLWSKLPRLLAQGDGAALMAFTPAQAIDALQKLCHDLLVRGAGAKPRFFAPGDLPPATPAMNPARLTRWSGALSRAARTAEHPFNPGLMLEALASEAHSVIRLP